MWKALLVLVSCALLAEESTDKLLQIVESLIEKERLSEAAAALEQALKSGPRDARVIYRLGYVQYRQRKLAAARLNFEEVLRLAPPALDSRYFLGRIALLESKPQEAVTWLKPVAEAPSSFDAHSQLAKAYISLGQSTKAIPELKAAAAQSPWDDGISYRLGQIYQKLGKPELAAEEFSNSRRLKNINREDVEILLQVSQLLGSGQSERAVALGSGVQDRANADPSTVHALGVLYGTANLPANALQAFNIAAARDPALFQAQLNRGLALLKMNRAAEAIDPLQRAVNLLPQSVEANLTLGLAAAMNRDYATAIDPLARAWRADATNPRVGLLLATAYLRTGDPRKALPILRAIPPAEPTVLFLTVEALNGAGDPAAALEAAKLAATRFPSVSQAHLAYAQQLARVGRYQEARPEFEAALQLTPGQPEAELGIADSLQKAGDHISAIPHYRTALISPQTSLTATLGLARSLSALRQLDEASALLEEAVPQYPRDPAIRQELSRIYARAGKAKLAKEQADIAEQLKAAQD